MPLLSVQGLIAGYGGITAIKGIDFEVSEGEIVTLIGSNGAGKSTALRVISGLVRARSGTVDFLGKRTDRMPPHKIVAMGMEYGLMTPYTSFIALESEQAYAQQGIRRRRSPPRRPIRSRSRKGSGVWMGCRSTGDSSGPSRRARVPIRSRQR
jgi:ABC-type branched-subunit amino acid transport system ATPase component